MAHFILERPGGFLSIDLAVNIPTSEFRDLGMRSGGCIIDECMQ